MEMKKIIALNGSPKRNGNTALLLCWILQGCEQRGVETELLHIGDYSVEYCRGCHTCLRTGVCPIQDDLEMLKERLLAADGLVVGSPVYASRPTAQMKSLMDRLTLLNLYTRSFGKMLVVGAATSGVAPTRGTARELADFFGNKIGIVGVNTASLNAAYAPLDDENYPKQKQAAIRMGRKLADRVRLPVHVRRKSLKMRWINLLWRYFIVRLVVKNPEQFAGVIQIWRENGMVSAQQLPEG